MTPKAEYYHDVVVVKTRSFSLTDSEYRKVFAAARAAAIQAGRTPLEDADVVVDHTVHEGGSHFEVHYRVPVVPLPAPPKPARANDK